MLFNRLLILLKLNFVKATTQMAKINFKHLYQKEIKRLKIEEHKNKEFLIYHSLRLELIALALFFE